MVSLERDAVIIGMPTIRPVLSSGVIKYLLIVCAVLGAITLYLLATASANTALFAQHYLLLIALNGGLAVCLTALLGYQLFMLRRKLKAGVFGAKFTLRLVWLFAHHARQSAQGPHQKGRRHGLVADHAAGGRTCCCAQYAA